MALGGAAARSAGRPSSSHLWQEPSRLSRMQELSVRMRRRARATAARAAQFGKFGVQSRGSQSRGFSERTLEVTL